MSEEIIQPPAAEKKKMGTGAKVAIGCGSGCLVLVLLAVIGIIVSTVMVKKMVAKYEEELKGYGFEKVTSGQLIDVSDQVDEPILYKGQVVRVMGDCSTNMAILAQTCEIFGRVDGKLYFRGQVLTVHPGAEIMGGVDAQAQVLVNNGKIEGGIEGKYQLLNPPEMSQ